MKVRYIGRRPRDVAPHGSRDFHVKPGDVVEVSDSLGKTLLTQKRLWQKAKEASKSKDGDS